MKSYKIIANYGFKIRVHIYDDAAIKELEAMGFYFDDFYGDGSGDEIWKA